MICNTPEINEAVILQTLKSRLNRCDDDDQIDDMLMQYITAAVQEFGRMGIKARNNTDDIMLIVDYCAWRYSARDKDGEMPRWLRQMLRERWIAEVPQPDPVTSEDGVRNDTR